MSTRDPHLGAARIVADAGGEIVGRTRLQKVAYLMQLAGYDVPFPFEYRHYGPFSEDLATGMEIAVGLRFVRENEQPTDWGGWYSIYSTSPDRAGKPDAARARFAVAAKNIGSIELELAATAAFLFAKEGIGRDGRGDPWKETERRKPEKARDGRLEEAKAAYRKLRAISTPVSLPDLP